MPNPLNVSAHSALWHNTEAVVFHKVGWASGSATDATTNVSYALRRAATQRDLMAAELQATAVAEVFNIGASEIPDIEPDKGDYIVAADASWSVVKADKVTFGSRWRCLCVRQVD